MAAEAYIYGFPLIFDMQEVSRFIREGMGSVSASPLNAFGHAVTLTGPEDRFVSINNDTIYSIAQVDVSGGPVLLRVPDTAGRYYVLQFVDVWTENFAYVGRRATRHSRGARGHPGPGRRPRRAGVLRAAADLDASVSAISGGPGLPAEDCESLPTLAGP